MAPFSLLPGHSQTPQETIAHLFVQLVFRIRRDEDDAGESMPEVYRLNILDAQRRVLVPRGVRSPWILSEWVTLALAR